MIVPPALMDLLANRHRPCAVVFDPNHDTDTFWLYTGDILAALGCERDQVGVSSTAGATHISGDRADVFVYPYEQGPTS